MDTSSDFKVPYVEKLCESRTITECHSEPVKPFVRNGPILARIPVAITQSRIHIHVESTIRLDRPAADIRNCKRDIRIVRCKLLDLGNKRHGRIYMNGHIRESIEYAAADCINSRDISGDLRYMAVKIPFECSARVDYYMPPIVEASNRFITIGVGGAAGGFDGLGLFQTAQSDENSSLQRGGGCTEKLYCDIDDIGILEADITKEASTLPQNEIDGYIFDTITEQLIITITFTLLQKQFINIPRNSSYSSLI